MQMKEQEILSEIKDKLKDTLLSVSFVSIESTGKEVPLAGGRPDLQFEIMVRNQPRTIVVEVKSVGEPRPVRSAIQQLGEYLKRIENAYGIVAAPYISEYTAILCKENGIGYIDLAGNCFLNFDQVYIERKNYPNPITEKRQARSIFTPKSSRILRVMLSNPIRSWRVQELAIEANVSLGLASKIKERLLDLDYIREENRGFLVSRPEELLNKWADSYSFRKNKIYDYFSLDGPKAAEKKLAEYCQQREIPYALSLFSGAALVAPFARYTRGFAYVAGEIPNLAELLDLKEAPSGPNFSILEPYDEGVFYGSRKVDDREVVCDVQLYLDLVGFKGRGEESAKYLLEQRMKTKW